MCQGVAEEIATATGEITTVEESLILTTTETDRRLPTETIEEEKKILIPATTAVLRLEIEIEDLVVIMTTTQETISVEALICPLE